jgi:hypothetical protein
MRSTFRVSRDAGTTQPVQVAPPPMSSKTSTINILDVPLPRKTKEVSLSAFSYLFTGIVQYYQERVTHGSDLEQKLLDLGYSVGYRFNELCIVRDKTPHRENRIVPMLQFISNTVWKSLYNKKADSLEQSQDVSNRYMIYEAEPIESKFISIPKSLSGLHCSYFTAGIIKGILTASEFPAEVKVFFTQKKDFSVFIVEFDQSVIERDLAWNAEK